MRLRRLAARLGWWLVDWSNRGRRIHYCSPPPREHGFTYFSQMTPEEALAPEPGMAIVELGPGETCYRCGERNTR